MLGRFQSGAGGWTPLPVNWRLDYRTVSKRMCSLEDGCAYFKGVLTQRHKSNTLGLLKAKIKLLLKEVTGLGLVYPS